MMLNMLWRVSSLFVLIYSVIHLWPFKGRTFCSNFVLCCNVYNVFTYHELETTCFLVPFLQMESAISWIFGPFLFALAIDLLIDWCIDCSEGADGELEGLLGRKHAWETTTKKAANRYYYLTTKSYSRCLVCNFYV